MFEFGADYLLDTTTQSSGTIAQQVRYALSPTGYPITFTIGVPSAPTQTGSYTYDNCRLVGRTLLGADGVVVEQLSYTYDSVGHVLSRLAADTTGDTYDYACWN